MSQKGDAEYIRDFLAHHHEEVMIESIWDALEDASRLRESLIDVLVDLNTQGQ